MINGYPYEGEIVLFFGELPDEEGNTSGVVRYLMTLGIKSKLGQTILSPFTMEEVLSGKFKIEKVK